MPPFRPATVSNKKLWYWIGSLPHNVFPGTGHLQKIPKSKFGCDLLQDPPTLKIEDKDKDGPRVPQTRVRCGLRPRSLISDAVEADDIVDAHTLAAATLAIAQAILLGFADDVLDLEWRYKYALPPLMALPLLLGHIMITVRLRPPTLIRRWLTTTKLGDVSDKLLRVVRRVDRARKRRV